MIDLNKLEATAKAATPGPWTWAEDSLNERIAPMGKGGKRRAKPGRNIKDTLVYCLVGPLTENAKQYGAEAFLDRYDHRVVMALEWRHVRPDCLLGATPADVNKAFMEAANPATVLDLIKQIRTLQADIETLRMG